MSAPREWPIGSLWSLVDSNKPEREIMRAEVVRVTKTQVIVRAVETGGEYRFRRDDGRKIGNHDVVIYRVLIPYVAPAEVQP